MPKYQVDLKPVAGHAIPPLLGKFGSWLSSQEYGSVGWFSLHAETVPVEWDADRIPRIQRNAFSFLHLPDGSLILLVNAGNGSPPAVGLLGSEGDTDSVATSLEEFLILLSNAETGISDLDEEEASGRTKLKTWLTKNKIKAPKAPPFDFDSFLHGTAKSSPPAVTQSGSPPAESLKMLPPFVRQLALMVGRRADDAELVEFVTGTLGQKVPNSTTSESKNVVAKKHGLELVFHHDVKNAKYPLVPKSKTSYVPYLSLVWLNPKLPGPLPFGLRFGMSVEEITGTLGDPAVRGSLRIPYWERDLDPTRDIVFQVDLKTITVKIKQALELMPRGESRPLVGLLVAWLASRGFLEPIAFPGHETLLEAVRERKERGSKLVEAALPRGLWDIHLKDLPGFRNFAYGWTHNIGGMFIRDDLVSVFGSRKGPYGHAEAVLDDDDWQAVDKATPVLDRRFAEWRSLRPNESNQARFKAVARVGHRGDQRGRSKGTSWIFESKRRCRRLATRLTILRVVARLPNEAATAYNRARFREDRPMTVERETLRDWHRLFGLLLTDFFTGSPFRVEVERDLSVQQQLLDVTIIRRGRGRFAGLPDGLEGLRPHNLMTFKSRHEALDGWALKELVGADVAYRKLVSPSPSQLLADDQFGLYAVVARFPHNLSGQVPWQRVQAGVYDCRWGTDTIRVVVAGELPPEAHNAPLHLFSAAPNLVEFGGSAYQRRSEQTSRLLGQLFEKLRGEGFAVSFTMEDFNRQYIKEHFAQLTPEEQQEALQALPPEKQQEVLQALPPERRLAGLSPEQIRQYLARLSPQPRAPARKPRRKMQQPFEKRRGEGFAMSFTMEDFNRQYIKEHFAQLTLEEQREAFERLSPEHRREVLQALSPHEWREVLRSLPPKELLAALSVEQIREYLEQLTAGRPEQPRKARRKK